MREIKFRAWDEKQRKILRVTMMDFAEWWVSCRPPGTLADPLEYGERNSFKNEETDRHILMQYTGLKDKNDISVYEKDVVTDGEIIGEVYWHDYMGYSNKIGHLAWWVGDPKKPTLGVELGDCEQGRTWEIIGNICEYPDLLKTYHFLKT